MAQDSLSEAPDSFSSLMPSTIQSQLDSSQSRNVSFSRLNAQAPEFVPARPPLRTDLQHQPLPPPPQQSPMLAIPPPPPPPPPPGVLHIFHQHPPASPYAPIPSHGQGPTHMLPVQNHHHHSHPHLHLHHQPQQHSYHIPVQYNPHQHQHYSGRSGFSKQEAATPQALTETDHSNSSKTKHSEETTQRLLNQVEYYFSDLNLATTDHLMRFISKDPDGYVPISVVASFKKIKVLITSHSQLANVLRNSSKLVVSEDGKKVRRQCPLTVLDMEELQSRIVIAENLPEDHCHQNLMKVFSAVGSVKSIRTCQPQTSNGGASSASRSGKAESMLYSNKLHAFVEYESVEMAEKAVVELNDEGNWRSGLRVRLMLKRTSKIVQARGKKVNDMEVNCDEDDTSDLQQKEKQADDASQQCDTHPHEYTGEEHGNDKDVGQRKGRSRGRNKGRGRLQYHPNIVGTPPSSNCNSFEQPGVAKQPPGPRMPDGTRGFAMGRGKQIAVEIA